MNKSRKIFCVKTNVHQLSAQSYERTLAEAWSDRSIGQQLVAQIPWMPREYEESIGHNVAGILEA